MIKDIAVWLTFFNLVFPFLVFYILIVLSLFVKTANLKKVI